MNQDKFSHVIITRFNLPTSGKEATLRCTPTWLEDRFALFDRYCFPSVAAQSCLDFYWIVLFDEETPVHFKKRIESYKNKFNLFYPYYTCLFPGTGWAEIVRNVLGDHHEPWLLSTNLDNDDSLAEDHIYRLQQTVRSTGAFCRGAFNMMNGAILANSRLYKCVHRSNAFASWFEPYDNQMRTAPSIAHMTFALHGPVIQIDGPVAWLQVVHGNNVSNKVRGRRIQPDITKWPFPSEIFHEIRKDTNASIFIENLTLGNIRTLRDAILWFYNKYYRNKQYVKRSLDSF